MALSYNWPDVYPTITDLSQIVTANSETVCAYVGESEYGPINTPVNVSGLKGFVDKFGNLNPKYGLTGYSIAVAQDTINSHYFVRVVDEATAKYAATAIPCDGETLSQELTEGYAVGGEEGIQSIIESEGDVAEALFSALEDGDRDNTAMVVLAQNPNNRDVKVSVVDSTIIETKADYVNSVSLSPDASIAVELGAPALVPGVTTTTQNVVGDSEDPSNNEITAVVASLNEQLTAANTNVVLSYNSDTRRVTVAINTLATPQVQEFTLSGSETLLSILSLTAGTYTSDLIGGEIPVDSPNWPIEGGVDYGNLSISTRVIKNTWTLNEVVAALNTGLAPIGLGASVSSYVITISNPNNIIFNLSDRNNGGTLTYLGLTPGIYTGNVVGHFIESEFPISHSIGSVACDTYPVTVTFTTSGIYDLTDPTDELHYLEVGSKVSISNSSDKAYNGVYKVESVTSDTFTIKYNKILSSNATGIRWVKYPEITETTFNIKVYVTTGKITTLVEEWENLTLYPHKDNTGVSTFVEDVVNGNSNLITVYANPDLDFTETQTSYPEKKALLGGTSGKIGVEISDLNKGWDYYKDRSRTNITLLMGSGYTSLSYQSKMLEIAEHRRDCFCLFDAPKDKVDPENIIDWRKNDQGFNSYRGSLSTPWVKTYDSVQGRSGFLMAPSAFLAKIIGSSDPWVAPAGLNRGMVTSSVTSPMGLTAYFDETQGGNLYNNQLNCIIKNPGGGFVNWGQKTLQQKSSALDRINVARTVIFIETTLRDAARYHLFENNTAFLRTQITLQFSQFLDRVLASGGLNKYQVICDESNNTPYVIANNQLVIDIYLWPVYTAEFIILNTTVMGPEASVTVSTSSNS